ncbi:hypothetical protein [Shewanella woodyi]|uniref:Rap1a immunity protein domain-containing protein n=1 Tax=Shewanella woodyi (strain ATCC 51908 / MS32) TaxID=392500 RepID=B1KG67_SHEWM|nr:hypothetical protein [Shewanella woodyi]ACA88204.1 conserved hypothetical protein [Shewanella woodyi ATCC 51908]
MKSSQILLVLTLVLPFSLLAAPTDLTNEERVVLESCTSLNNTTKELTAAPCVYYVRGFLAGSLSTKSTFIVRETSGEFLDRAYRTRVGKQTSEEQPIQLCLPKDKNIEQLTQRLIEHFSPPIESMEALHTQISDALGVELPCS